ncbi:TRAP transporter small permease [Halobacteriovorax sp. HLS]|uniref:TRAP transporter small permease n=1 Tax=Halobacteriovorax sp. HLS TaxID=2234000 RepID=UPI000FD8A3A8|nr:TRAP transporter small permease [Halobacteriovorax sp. HLS]
MKVLGTLDQFLEKFARYGLVFSVLTMLILSVLTIVLRWFDTTIHWVEPFVRHLVFLSTFLGGVLATGRGEHIGIDIVSKWLEARHLDKAQAIIKRIISLASCLTLLWMIKASYDFFLVELKYGKEVFWGIKSGYLVAIIPFGFSLIAYRFFYSFISSFGGDE